MLYPKLIDKLFQVNLFGGMKLGLENCRRFQEILQKPTQDLSCIHVAGTNGKGSVTTMIAKALEASGLRVGLYTSPHISCFRERIRINGEMISESAIEELLPFLFTTAEQNAISATFFELTTFLAFLHFSREQVDIVVLETGLGGRLDATNIVTPILSIITSISLDHTQILGSTVEEIASEKGGIIKYEVPVVIGPRVPLAPIKRIADEMSSPLTTVTGTFDSFMEENQAIAREALRKLNICESSIAEGLKARQPCRMEILNDRVILDVGHNPDGLNHLFQAIQHRFGNRRIRLLFGLSKTKDIQACLQILCQNGHAFHLVEAANGRGISLAILHEEIQRFIPHGTSVSCHQDIEAGVKESLRQAEENNELLVICGTFFIMSEARRALGIQEPVDSFDMNERG